MDPSISGGIARTAVGSSIEAPPSLVGDVRQLAVRGEFQIGPYAFDPEHADWLASPGKLSFVRLRSGRPGRFPSPEEAAAHAFSPAEEALLRERMQSQIIGGPAAVRAGLAARPEQRVLLQVFGEVFVRNDIADDRPAAPVSDRVG